MYQKENFCLMIPNFFQADRKYSKEALESALLAIKEKTSTIRAASRFYGVPFTTLRRLQGELNPHKTFGPSPVLTVDEEKELVRYTLI